MNRIEKTTTFIAALTITLLGATFATAPLVLAGSKSIASHPHSNAAQVLACNTCAAAQGVVGLADRY